MKFACNQSDLNANLSLVSHAVPSRPTHPILGNVLLTADKQKGEVSLTAFDLSLGIHTSFGADVSKDGKTTLPAKLLNDIVSRLPDGEIELVTNNPEAEQQQAVSAILTAATGEFQLRGMRADEFPSLPQAEEANTIQLPVTALAEGLRGALFAASADETKQILTGVHLTGKPDNLEFAATDGHRLSVVETPLENAEAAIEPFSLTIPARALRELERMLGTCQETDTIYLHVGESQVIFEVNHQRLTSRKLEGAYPNYHQLIPQTFERNVSLERKRLLSSLERVAVLADQKNNLVKFTLDGETSQLALSVEAQDLGSAKESMGAEITGEGGEIAFNIRYLMDGLKALPANEIQFQLNQSNQPAILTPLSGIKMTYLVMPVQIVQ